MKLAITTKLHTHELSSNGCTDNDGQVGGNEGHTRLHVLKYAGLVFRQVNSLQVRNLC